MFVCRFPEKTLQISHSDVIRALTYISWVPEDIFFLTILMVRGEAASTKREAPREKNNVLSPSGEPYQTVSTVYFILGILRTDLWSQSSADLSPVRKKTPQRLVKQKPPKGDFNRAVSFRGGEGGCPHSGHQACR